MNFLGLDPGPQYTAYAYLESGHVSDFGIRTTDGMLDFIKGFKPNPHENRIAIEMIHAMGMAVGREVFETCFNIGRFAEAARIPYTLIYRHEEKMFLCNSMKAKDSNIRQAIIDIFGGKEKAIGNAKSHGPLYGMKKDMWQALAVALTAQNKFQA